MTWTFILTPQITQQFTKVIAQRKKDSKGQDQCAELVADQKKAGDVLEALEKAEAVAVASRDKLCSEIGNPLDVSYFYN